LILLDQSGRLSCNSRLWPRGNSELFISTKRAISLAPSAAGVLLYNRRSGHSCLASYWKKSQTRKQKKQPQLSAVDPLPAPENDIKKEEKKKKTRRDKRFDHF
jgi:hypothetical protein